MRREAAGDACAALGAGALLVELVMQQVIPVAFDQRGFAARAESRAAFDIVDIAGIDMMQAVGQRNPARALQGGGRRGRHIKQLVVGVEGAEMQRHIGTQFGGDPARQSLQLGLDA